MKLSGKRTAIGHNSGKRMHRRGNSIDIEESLRFNDRDRGEEASIFFYCMKIPMIQNVF